MELNAWQSQNFQTTYLCKVLNITLFYKPSNFFYEANSCKAIQFMRLSIHLISRTNLQVEIETTLRDGRINYRTAQ